MWFMHEPNSVNRWQVTVRRDEGTGVTGDEEFRTCQISRSVGNAVRKNDGPSSKV